MLSSGESSNPSLWEKSVACSTAAANIGDTMGALTSLGLMALSISAAIANPALGSIALAICTVLFAYQICCFIGHNGSSLIGFPLFFTLGALKQGITNLHRVMESNKIQCFSAFTGIVGDFAGAGAGIYLIVLSISAALANPATGPIMLATAACLFSFQISSLAGKLLGEIAGLMLAGTVAAAGGIISGCCSCLFGGGRASRHRYERGLDDNHGYGQRMEFGSSYHGGAARMRVPGMHA